MTARPIVNEKIRAARKKPGLMRQHLTAVQAAAEVGDAELEGATLGSRRLVFRPGPVRAVNYTEKSVGRAVSEEELLCYRTLGATSLKEGRPLLRPVVHGFVRGISGAVVTFPKNNAPELCLSSEDERKRGNKEKWWRPRVFTRTTCTTCDTHYYVSFPKDFGFANTEPEGGQLAEEGKHYREPSSSPTSTSAITARV